MPQTVHLFVPGINTVPGDAKDWNIRANTWTNLNTEVKTDDCEYFCGPIGRAFGQKDRSQKLLNLIQSYAGWDIVLSGHSNGCAVALQALSMGGWPCLKSLHLFNGACESDFAKNGLNMALSQGRIGSVSVYKGGKDVALWIASWWPSKMLGYGDLGRMMPQNVDKAVERYMHPTIWPDYGHSTCWHPDHFDETMKLIV